MNNHLKPSAPIMIVVCALGISFSCASDSHSASATATASAFVVPRTATAAGNVSIRYQRFTPVARITNTTSSSAGAIVSGIGGIVFAGVDENGKASFSIAGDTTSSYTIQLPVNNLSFSQKAQESFNLRNSGTLFSAEQILSSQGSLSVVISQAEQLSDDSVSVTVNYN